MKESIAAALRKRIAHTAHYNSPNSVQRVISLSARLRNAYAKVSGIKKSEPVIAAAPLDKPTNIADTNIANTTITASTISSLALSESIAAISGPTQAQKYAHELSVLGTSVDNISRVFEKPMTAFEIATAFAQLNVTAYIALSHDKDYEVAARPHVQYVHAIAAIAKQIANADPREQMLWRVLDAQKQMGRTQVVAEEGAEGNNAPPPEDDNTLKITIDADSTKLVQRLYVDYVSETNMAKLPQFMIAFDRLLFKFRDGKPLSPEEIHEVNEVDQARAIKKKKAKKSKKPVRTEAPTDTGEGEAPQEEAAPPEDEEPGDLDEIEVASSLEITAGKGKELDGWFTRLWQLYESDKFAFFFFLAATKNYSDSIRQWIEFWINAIIRNPHTSFRPYNIAASMLFLRNKNGVEVHLPFRSDEASKKSVTLFGPPTMIEPGKTAIPVLEKDIPFGAHRRLTSELEKIDKLSFEQAQEYFKQRATGGE